MVPGDYIVYVDESGDHGLEAVNPDYPVFVLSFCIFRKDDYADIVVPSVIRLKFETFGHDMVVLHERDIRKKQGAFSRMSRNSRETFMVELTEIVEKIPFTIVAVAIRKRVLARRYPQPGNPYNIALCYGLERVHRFLRERSQSEKLTHVVFEARGKKEDKELELEFRRVCTGENSRREQFPLRAVFADKRCNSPGLQLADMTARPIGLSVMRPGQFNRAMKVIVKKLRSGPKGEILGYGVKVFP